MVDNASGVLIKPIDNEQIIHDLSQAMERLASDHVLRKRLSMGAQHRIKINYRWENKGEIFKEIYTSAILGTL